MTNIFCILIKKERILTFNRRYWNIKIGIFFKRLSVRKDKKKI